MSTLQIVLIAYGSLATLVTALLGFAAYLNKDTLKAKPKWFRFYPE